MRSLSIPIKVLAVRMDVSNSGQSGQSGFWIAIVVGGLVIGTMSFVQQYTSKDPNENLRLRAVFRDFCIGAFLTAAIYMFLPDSIESIVSSGKSAISNTFTGGFRSTAVSIPSSDIELQIGPARF